MILTAVLLDHSLRECLVILKLSKTNDTSLCFDVQNNETVYSLIK